MWRSNLWSGKGRIVGRTEVHKTVNISVEIGVTCSGEKEDAPIEYLKEHIHNREGKKLSHRKRE